MRSDRWMILRAALGLAVTIALTGSAAAVQERPIRIDPASGQPYVDSLPGFDCHLARSFAEKTVCATPNLGRADHSLDYQYRWVIEHTSDANRERIREAQKAWLAKRDRCESVECVEAAYAARGKVIAAAWTRLDRARRFQLTRAGACDKTRIEEIGGRLQPVEGEPPDGVSVSFADGIFVTDYDRPATVVASRIGDPVRVCLVSIPRHCPKGDDRGRVYSVVNLRTRGRWKMPDAEHSCGGA
jgi:uncharacterized protein YecT (DUF1311 family)